jgi:periplasmic protein CpxP/Spy
MNISKWMVITMATGATAGGLIVFKMQAAESTQSQRPLRGQLLQRAKEKLELTNEQITKIKNELNGEAVVLKGLISKLHQTRVALRVAIQASDANESTVRAASAKMAAVEADLAVERLRLFNKLCPILTTEQREMLKELQTKIDDFLDNAIGRMGERLSSE